MVNEKMVAYSEVIFLFLDMFQSYISLWTPTEQLNLPKSYNDYGKDLILSSHSSNKNMAFNSCNGYLVTS